MREAERQRKINEREARANLRIWEKTTSNSRMSSIRPIRSTFRKVEQETLKAEKTKGSVGVAHAASAALKGSEWRAKTEKENMTDFISKKREMFLVQMSLDTKREEIRKLEEKAQMKEEALRKSECMLEEDAIRFDAFLKDNDQKAHNAIKDAEKETKLKQDKVSEIKKLSQHISSIRSDTSKLEEQLQLCLQYKAFLDELTPKEWFVERANARLQRRKRRMEQARDDKVKEWEDKKAKIQAQWEGWLEEKKRDLEKKGLSTKDVQMPRPKFPPQPTFTDTEDDYRSDDEEEEMYFKDPRQLLDIFVALEESNLFLIQNSQETEQALEELRQDFRETKEQMQQKTDLLEKNIEQLKAQIREADLRAASLRARAQESGGEDAQQALLKALNEKVKAVYRKCAFDADTSPSTLAMLTDLEARLEELLEAIEQMPEEYVQSAERQKEKERREKVRVERVRDQKEQYERKLAKSMLRAMQAPKIRQGRPIMFRAKPKRVGKKKHKEVEVDEEKNDDDRFFEP